MGLISSILGTHFKVVSPEKIQKKLKDQKEAQESKERYEYLKSLYVSNPIYPLKNVCFGQLVPRTFYRTFKTFRKENPTTNTYNKLSISFLDIQEQKNKIPNVFSLSSKELEQEAKKYLENFAFIREQVNKLGSKKEIKLITDIENTIRTDLASAYQKTLDVIKQKEQELKVQKSEVQSSSKADANDPQKAEKLAKIAKLQRELDELKDEVK